MFLTRSYYFTHKFKEVTEMFYKASQGWSGRRLKQWLDEKDITTRNGKTIPLSSILAMLINPFYYGTFQYPEGPGNTWYKGAHKPLISKELFDQVQQSRGVYKGQWGSKTFAFKGLLKCGKCGGEFTAQEKIKTLKTGEYKRHVYYNCTHKVDPKCNEPYINQDNLRILLLEFIEKNYKKIDINDKLRAKIEKHYSITQNLLGYYKLEQKLDKPFIEYSRYVLKKGNENEMTNFSQGIKTSLSIKNGVLFLRKE